MGDKRADPAHLRLKFLDEEKILRQLLRRLEGRPHHEAAAGLIADLLQVTQAAHAAVIGHFLRMELLIMRSGSGLVAQQIPFGPGVEQALIAFPAALSKGERDRAVRIRRPDPADQLTEPAVLKPAVLSALQDEGAKTQIISLAAALQDLLRRKPVALAAGIASADPAVKTVVSAEAADLDQPPDVYVVSVDLPAQPHRAVRKPCSRLRRTVRKEKFILGSLQPVLRLQPPDEGKKRFIPVHG